MKVITQYSVAIIFLLCCSFSALIAQTHFCQTDELYHQLKQSNPQLEQIEKEQNKFLYDETIRQSTLHSPTPSVTRTIPVVVHIIHNNGPENISDSIVIEAINQLNLRYQNAAPYFDSDGTNINIQFCLASIDPYGNPTTGITRNVSTLINMQFGNITLDTTMKSLNRWQPLLYLNIWVVNQILPNYTGYAYYPTSLGHPEDGVVVVYNGINGEVLSHEVGHYFWLYHTFEGGCTNFNCLNDGDHVCDTPPDQSNVNDPCPSNSCSTDMDDTTGLNPFTTDVNDAPDYMDYTSCPDLFTQGQSQRMNNALTGIRHLLLVSNGCGQNPNIGPPVAGYSHSIASCYTGMVTFTNTSHNYAIQAFWDFNNDGIYDTTGFTVSHTFTTGNHTVKEMVIGVNNGKDSIYHTFFVQHSPSYYYPLGGAANVSIDIQGNFSACAGASVFFTAAPSLHYHWFNGDTTQNIIFIADTTVSVWVQTVDSAGLSWSMTPCYPVPVTIYPSPPPVSIYASDTTWMCQGQPIHMHSTVDSTQFNYQWYSDYFNIGGATDSTLDAYPSHFNEPYFLRIANSSGCYSYSDTIMTSGNPMPVQQGLTANGNVLSTLSGFSREWFRDSIAIPGATGTTYTVTQDGCYSIGWYFPPSVQCITMSDSVFCFTTTGLNELANPTESLVIYPNPGKDILNITIANAEKNASISICNMLGQEVYSMKIINNSSISIPVADLAASIYTVSLKSDKGTIIKKWVKE